MRNIREKYNMSEGTIEGIEEKYDLFVKIVEEDECEPFWAKGLGWVYYEVLDTAGSISITISEEENCGGERFKMLFYGTYGNLKGRGCVYYDLEENTYMSKREFADYEEGRKVLAEVLKEKV